MNRRQFIQYVAASASAVALPRAFAQAPVKLKFTLDFRVSGQTAPFFVALSKGYYKDEGLEPSFDVGNGSVASITRVASGAYDMGFGDISSLIEFNASQPGAPLVQAVYQYYNRAPFAIICRKDRGVTDFKSLAGKHIAAAAVESTKRVWPMVAKKSGMKPEAINWVTTDFNSRDNVVVRGDVDGATYFHDSAVSLFQRMKMDELVVLPYESAGVSLYGNAILASTKLIEKDPKLVAAFLRATNRGLQETLANPLAAMQYVKLREALIDEKVEAERFKITAGYVATADTREHGLGDVKKALVQQQVDAVAETFALKTKPSADSIYNLAFLPAKADRMVRT